MTAHMNPKEIAALRATISTLPISDETKRTWLAVVRTIEQMPNSQAEFQKRYAEAMECFEKAKQKHLQATALLVVVAMFSAATFGMLLGGLM